MSSHISEEFKGSGVARVIVVLTPTAEAADRPDPEPILQQFVVSEYSQVAALAAAAPGKRPAPSGLFFPHLGVCLGTVDRPALTRLRQAPGVARVLGAPPLSMIRPKRIAAAALTRRSTWGLDLMGVPRLWDQGLDGSGVRVGHLDTGVDGKHPALRKAVAAFAEFDELGRQVRPEPRSHDTDDHGTHTAGTIAGRPVQGRSIGVAPKALLCSAIVIEGGDVVARVLGGMDWAVGQGVKILSMSLGFRGWWDDFLPLTRILRTRGILPVFAVGNEGAGTSRSPGNYSEALSVGAVDRNQRVASFSSSDRFRRKRDPVVPDLLAPGVDVISAKPRGGYQAMDGTSMATPHVAGLAALLWQARPEASVSRIERAIFRSCVLPPGASPGRYGKGIPDGPKALQSL
jgi:subtilisin family serine protease